MRPSTAARFAVALAALGCASGSSAGPASHAEPTALAPGGPPPSPPPPNGEPTPVEPACALSSPTVRLRIDRGQTVPTGTGLSITYEGASHDNYGPEGFDLLIALRFQRGDERDGHLPSFRDRRTYATLGHCYRLLDADESVVLLEVSALPAEERGSESPLVGAGAPPAGAAGCTQTDDNGPLEVKPPRRVSQAPMR